MSSDDRPPGRFDGYAGVSIPSSSGHVFGPSDSERPLGSRLVSIPSSSGHVFGPACTGGDAQVAGFNPLVIGACLRTHHRRLADGAARFQSPRHRGMSSDTAASVRQDVREFQSPRHRGMSSDWVVLVSIRPLYGSFQSPSSSGQQFPLANPQNALIPRLRPIAGVLTRVSV